MSCVIYDDYIWIYVAISGIFWFGKMMCRGQSENVKDLVVFLQCGWSNSWFHCWQGVLQVSWRTWRPGKDGASKGGHLTYWFVGIMCKLKSWLVNQIGGEKKRHPCSMSGFETYKKCQNRLDRDTDMPWYIYTYNIRIYIYICTPSVSNRWFCSYPKSGCCSSTCWFHQKAHRLLPHSDTYLYYVVGCLGRPSLSLFICTWPALAVQKQWDHIHTQNSWFQVL